MFNLKCNTQDQPADQMNQLCPAWRFYCYFITEICHCQFDPELDVIIQIYLI